jgi:type I restriction-modification system DNA methylase subunit
MARRTRRRAEARARYYIREISRQKGWNLNHVSAGGDCLEEQEITSFFPNIGLGQDRPDFLFTIGGEPSLIIEAKNEAGRIDEAIQDAIDYADTINQTGRYSIKLIVGAAGEERTGFTVYVRFLRGSDWMPLVSNGYEISTIPSKREAELALEANDGTTTISIPANSEFIDTAIELSRILRSAKVEAPLRPKVIGAIILAMYQGDINANESDALDSINSLVQAAINSTQDIAQEKKEQLIDALGLSGADFQRLAPYIRRVIALLRRLNIRSVLQTDTDFLGMFYEAFLRYGYDNTALGIVFTPRHITRFCVDMLQVSSNDRVIDVASGTGGFLVAAYDRMIHSAQGATSTEHIKNSIYGFDTNPTVWALSTLNMFFRGDGKTNMSNGDCFAPENRRLVRERFTRAFLNPPFSQEDEPERDFIDASMDALEPSGELAVLVYAGIFADSDHENWRREFTRRHKVLGVISLPEDLFYPVASAPTSILIAKAHIPQSPNDDIFMARVWNDGFEKLKNRRIERAGSQLPEILRLYHGFINGLPIDSEIVSVIEGRDIQNGEEWSPQQWLKQPHIAEETLHNFENDIVNSIFQSIAVIPDLANQVLGDMTEEWSENPDLPLNQRNTIEYFFNVKNGKSAGAKNYLDGDCPYISSGDSLNSIIRTASPEESQVFKGGITVTAFGHAYVQPWPFMARGNGGSSVRVLTPKFNMSFKELLWFASQINSQQWRFFYARMAIKTRITRLLVESSPVRIPDVALISDRITSFRDALTKLRTM